MISAEGLDGDRGRAGKRAATLIQQEQLAAIGFYLGRGAVVPDVLRPGQDRIGNAVQPID